VLVRTKDVHDSSIPAGNSVAVLALLRIAALTGRTDFRQKAEATLIACQGEMAANPLGMSQLLIALDFFLGPVQEIAIVGDPANEETRRVLRYFRGQFRPNQVLTLRRPDEGDGGIALLKDKPTQGTVTTYICQNFTCQTPLIGAEAVEKLQ
jgi:uncharacterized protein YyaL (SSP411 family)